MNNTQELPWQELKDRIFKITQEELTINLNVINKQYHLKIAYGERMRDAVNATFNSEESAFLRAHNYLERLENPGIIG